MAVINIVIHLIYILIDRCIWNKMWIVHNLGYKPLSADLRTELARLLTKIKFILDKGFDGVRSISL